MAWTLGIDTSSAELALGLFADGKPAASLSRYIGHSHAEHITTSIEFLMRSNGITALDIDRTGITVGPGSFTGLRIGIGFIKGFFFGRPVRILPVSSLEALAAAWPHPGGSLVTVLDARRGEVFWARFTMQDGLPLRTTADTLATLPDFISCVNPGEQVIFDSLGYTASTIAQSIPDAGRVHRIETTPLHRGLACARIAATERADSSRWQSLIDLEPVYMRASAPEEKAAADLKSRTTIINGAPS